MWPFVVVHPHPCPAHEAGLTEVIKGIRVKYLFAECPVKPLDVAVLMGLALLNENDPDLVLLSPVTELLRNEFRSIVDTNTLRLASPFDEFIKLALYTSLVRLVSIAIARTSLLKSSITLKALKDLPWKRPSCIKSMDQVRLWCNGCTSGLRILEGRRFLCFLLRFSFISV